MCSTRSQAEKLFEDMKSMLTGDVVSKIGTVFQVQHTPHTIITSHDVVMQWNITGADGKLAGQWTTDLKNGAGNIYFGPSKTKAEARACYFQSDAISHVQCTLTLGDDTFEGLVSNTLDPMKAFMGGKLKIAGNVMLAQKLQTLFNPASKL